MLEQVWGNLCAEVVRGSAPPQSSMSRHFIHASVYHRGVSLHCVEGTAEEGLIVTSSVCRCTGGEGVRLIRIWSDRFGQSSLSFLIGENNLFVLTRPLADL
jgi:hypothetical protein